MNPIEKAWQHHKDQYPGEVQWERCAFVSGWDAAKKQDANSLLLNHSRVEELINLLDTLDQYLKLGSSDGKPVRVELRDKLKVLAPMVRKRLFETPAVRTQS